MVDKQKLKEVESQIASQRGGPLWCREYYLASRLIEEAVKQLDARTVRRAGKPDDEPEDYAQPKGCSGCGD